MAGRSISRDTSIVQLHKDRWFVVVMAQYSVVSGDGIRKLLLAAHALAHEDGGCDPRPLLYSALVVNELRPLFEYLDDEERSARISSIATALSFLVATEIEKIVGELGDALPEEEREKYRTTLH